jgi:polyhydroxyalkanoate synthase
VADGYPPDADAWRAAAARQPGSWWADWTAWAAPRAGDQVPPPPMGSGQYPAAAAAPGEYVLG